MRSETLLVTHRAAFGMLLRQSLERHADLRPVRLFDRVAPALRRLRARGSVALVDLSHPVDDVFGALRDAGSRAIVFAGSSPVGWVSRSLEAGVGAYLGKCARPEDFAAAIRAVRGGQRYFTPCAARVVAEIASRSPLVPHLSPQERRVLSMVCDGRTSKEIGRAIGRHTKSIEGMRAQLMRKARVHSAAALVRWACAERFIDLRPAGELPHSGPPRK